MQYYECKCGESTAFGSMSPSRCTACPKCGTRIIHVSFRNLPADHPYWKPVEHNWVKQYDTDTGEPYERCLNCLEKRELK